MKTKFSIIILISLMLLSLASISFVSSSNIKTNIMSTKFVAPIKPAVNIIYPEQGSSLLAGLHIITVSATSANGIKAVELKIDGPESSDGWLEIMDNQNSEGQYFYDWTVSIGGDYSITARATNTANRKTDDTISVTVVTEPPEPVHDVAITSVSALPTSVEIGSDVIVSVIAENQGTFVETFDVTSFFDSNVLGTQTEITLNAGYSITLNFVWDTTGVAANDYMISAEASLVVEDVEPSNNVLTDGIVTVTEPGQPPTATHELFIEIDYMTGHAPTPEVLDYIKGYYLGNNPSGDVIQITFLVEDVDEVPYDPSVSETDFWNIEAQYNDNDYGYYSSYKWVLFGSTVEGSPGVVGYTYVQSSRRDLLAGNYIFIADEEADNWATTSELEIGAEAVVLMHELGHSIGIAKVHPAFGEQYDPDTFSVMSYLSVDNAGKYMTWYYSVDYWATRNMEYYVI